MERAQEYRYRAQTLREVAKRVSDALARHHLSATAAAYDRLADALEHRSICG
jgi:hypothetical protein